MGQGPTIVNGSVSNYSRGLLRWTCLYLLYHFLETWQRRSPSRFSGPLNYLEDCRPDPQCSSQPLLCTGQPGLRQQNHVGAVFSIFIREVHRSFLCRGGAAPPFSPPCFQAIHACDVFIMFAVGEGCAMGVLSPTARPPNPLISMLCSRRGPRRSEHLVKPSDHVTPPAFFKPAKACGKNSCHHHVCSRGRLCGSFICKWGCCLPLRPPPNPLVAMFAVGEGRADH